MKQFFIATASVILATIHLSAADAQPRSLLDTNLSQWEIFIGVPHQSVVVPGYPPSTSTNGQTGTPLGLGKDPLKIFTVEMQDGEPVLHITGQIYGGLTSLQEFENFHFSCQFKWGEKKWPPRLNAKRDNGILYYCTGPHGAFWNVWMRSLECQVQEGDCGDFIGLAGTAADLRAATNFAGPHPPFDPTAPVYSGIGYAAHGPSVEKPNGEWNTLEIYAIGDTTVHVVNGTPNMVLFNTRQKSPDGAGWIPLTRGKIQIQSEAAEAFYRDVKIQTITEFPESLRELTKKPDAPIVPFKYPAKDKK